MSFVSLIYHNKMVAVPEYYGWEGNFFHQIVHSALYGETVQSYALRTCSEVKQRNTLFCQPAPVAQILQGVVSAEILGNHFKACRSAVLRIHLIFYRKPSERHHFTVLDLRLSNNLSMSLFFFVITSTIPLASNLMSSLFP